MSDSPSSGPLPTPDFEAGDGLLPAVVQDAETGRVRMLGYMDRSALEQTVDTGRVTFYSRSRGRHWVKGETSGNWLEAVEIRMDCDGDALLVRARPHGPTCHTGDDGCFDSGLLWEAGGTERIDGTSGDPSSILADLIRVVRLRDAERPAGSYTTRLLENGPDVPARKLAEEAVELALAAVAGEDSDRQVEESADVLYHFLVLLRSLGLEWDQVARELEARRASDDSDDSGGTGGSEESHRSSPDSEAP